MKMVALASHWLTLFRIFLLKSKVQQMPLYTTLVKQSKLKMMKIDLFLLDKCHLGHVQQLCKVSYR